MVSVHGIDPARYQGPVGLAHHGEGSDMRSYSKAVRRHSTDLVTGGHGPETKYIDSHRSHAVELPDGNSRGHSSQQLGTRNVFERSGTNDGVEEIDCTVGGRDDERFDET